MNEGFLESPAPGWYEPLGGLLLLTLPIVVLGVASALALLAGSVIGHRELRAFVKVRPQALTERLRVVIPARNEAHRIGATLEAVLQEPSPLLEVVVYDDRSTDETCDIVESWVERDRRLLLLRGTTDPEPGTFGKPSCLARAGECADERLGKHEGAWLYLDADVVLTPGTLGGLVQTLREEGADALSGVPHFHNITLIEQLVVPVVTALVGMRHPPRAVHDERSATAFLNGQLILAHRDALAAVGGFAAVKSAVLEDVALARLLKQRGRKLRLALLHGCASTRMYTSWVEIRDGFGKNAVALFGGPTRTLFSAVGAFLLASGPWLGLVVGVQAEDAPLAALTIMAFLVGALSQLALRRGLHLPLWPVLVLPLAYALAAWVLLRAVVLVWTRRTISWRGRRYPASRH